MPSPLKEQILALHQQGLTTEQIAAKVQRSTTTVTRALSGAGVVLPIGRRKGQSTRPDVAERRRLAADLRAQQVPIAEIARQLKVSERSITYYLSDGAEGKE